MAKISRASYADMYGPTTGDKVRLADTELFIEVENDLTNYGEEVKFGGDRKNEADIPESVVCEKYGIEMEFNVGGGKIQSSSSLVGGEVEKPWGSYKTFEKGDGYLLKRMTVNPGEILSLQSHEHRSEFWYVSEGVATVECDDNVFDLKKYESTNIPLKSKHRLSNQSDEVLKVIEVQIGNLLSEDDITRYEDRYERD